MARWSDVAMPDDPLSDDDAVVGAEPEDVLLDGGAHDAVPVAAELDDAAFADVERVPYDALDDRPTTEISPVAAPPPAQRSWLVGIVPWSVFGAVAVVVIAATTTWASFLQGPTADRPTATPRIDPVPTTTAAAPPTPETVAPPPEPEPEPEAEPIARPTQRPRATRAPAPQARTPLPQSPAAGADEPPSTPDASAPEETAPTGSAPAAAAEPVEPAENSETGDSDDEGEGEAEGSPASDDE